MSIGYACLALGVPNTELKTCLIKNADSKRLQELITGNLDALDRMVDYNLRNGIRLFRISSEIIPFASSPVNTVPWAQVFQGQLQDIGRKIRESGMRISMHPGQYTVLNSPDEKTAANAVKELEYHAALLDGLLSDSSSKIVLHLGGAYGDKHAATKRFIKRYKALNDHVKARLVIENDDRIFNIGDVLETGIANSIPVVFDNLHHQTNPSQDSISEAAWIAECAKTWAPKDGRQKIHYAQPDTEKKPGAHSASIGIDAFLCFYESLGTIRPDIMLEVKDKNISAVKCMLCTQMRSMGDLEREWGRYKYLVLERSQQIYRQIRQLLNNKAEYPAVEFYRLTEAALALPMNTGSAINAAEHVWGYFKDLAAPKEKIAFLKCMDGYASGKGTLAAVKRKLYALSQAYGQEYLLESYYFVKQYDRNAEQGEEH